MATVQQTKDRYLVKSEKNGTNDGIAVDNLRFCLLYNEAQNKYTTLQLQNRGSDDIRYIQHLLILDKKIANPSKKQDKYNFQLPKNYFDLADVRAKAVKGECSRLISCEEIQTENLNQILQDEFHKPSFEWDEVPYTVNSNELSIYTDNFSISEILLNYYRYPNQIGLINEQDPESDFIANIVIEWDDKVLDDIVSLMVMNLDINQNNPRFQLQTIRIQK